MADLGKVWEGAVGSDLTSQYSSASNLAAAKYSPFDGQLYADEVFDSWFGGHKASDRLKKWMQDVYDRQYEMDVRKQQIDLENSAYQRAVADMKKAGLNPYWLMSGGSGQVASSELHDASSSKKNEKGSNYSSDIAKTILKVATSAMMFMMLAG